MRSIPAIAPHVSTAKTKQECKKECENERCSHFKLANKNQPNVTMQQETTVVSGGRNSHI